MAPNMIFFNTTVSVSPEEAGIFPVLPWLILGWFMFLNSLACIIFQYQNMQYEQLKIMTNCLILRSNVQYDPQSEIRSLRIFYAKFLALLHARLTIYSTGDKKS